MAGTEFVLTADISLSEVNRKISIDITWSRGNDVISRDTRITVSPVSGSGDSYTAFLTYSPIITSDSGIYEYRDCDQYSDAHSKRRVAMIFPLLSHFLIYIQISQHLL